MHTPYEYNAALKGAGLLHALVEDMNELSNDIDCSAGTTDYWSNVVALALVARQYLRARPAVRDALKDIVNRQANDAGLWFRAQTAPEAYLQQALRELHTAIERAP